VPDEKRLAIQNHRACARCRIVACVRNKVVDETTFRVGFIRHQETIELISSNVRMR